MKLSIIIPAYNEEATIREILEKVLRVTLGDTSKEIIIVNDGSRDKTDIIVQEVVKTHKDLIYIKHPKNKGKGAAVRSGIRNATGDILLVQDADLEYNPSDIPKIIKPIVDKKFRVVYGTRLKMKPVFFGKNKTPFLLHFFGNKFLSFATSILYGAKVTDMETGYKAFERDVLKGIRLKAHSFDFEPEITAKILKRKIYIKEVSIKTKPRGYEEGKKIRTFRDGSIALWTLIKYRFTN